MEGMKMLNSIVIELSGSSRYKEEEKKSGKFYFELRTDLALETLIQDRVICNNEGSIESSRDIISDAIHADKIPSRDYGVNWSMLYEIYKNIIIS